MMLELPKGVSGTVYRSVVAGASAAYSMNRRIPTIDEISRHCENQPKTISRVIATPEFKHLMKLRGFPMDTGATLTPEQYFAVQVITDPTNKKPLAVKLKQAGVTYAQYRAWLKQNHFRDYINKISEDMLGEHIADVHTMVVNKATGGDITAAKLFYELNGRHDPARQQMQDFQGIIGLLLEVITRYVTDPEALSGITRDVELIISGGTPDALGSMDLTRIAASDPDIINVDVLEDVPVGDFFDFDKD